MEIYRQKGYSQMPFFPMSPEKNQRRLPEIVVSQAINELRAAKTEQDRCKAAQQLRIDCRELFVTPDLYVRRPKLNPDEKKLRGLIAAQLNEQLFDDQQVNQAIVFAQNDLVQAEGGAGIEPEEVDDEEDEIWLSEELKMWRGD